MAYQGQTQSSPSVTSKYFQDDGQSGNTPAEAIDPGGTRTRLGETTDVAAPIGTENVGVIALIKGVLTKLPSLISGRVPVDGSGVTQPVSGTVTANAGTGTMTVDGSGVTQPVSAASLPLPTGAAAEATLGTRAADLTLQTSNVLITSIDNKTPDLSSGRVPVETQDNPLPTTAPTGQIAIATADTAIQLPNVPVNFFAYVGCKSDSPGPIYVGVDTNVSTTTGFEIPQGVSKPHLISNLNQLWFVGGNVGDTVTYEVF